MAFDDFEFICVDKGFPENEPVDVVIRPEDIDIVQPDKAKLKGIVKSVTFKGCLLYTSIMSLKKDVKISKRKKKTPEGATSGVFCITKGC